MDMNERILIIEDNQVNLDLLQYLLGFARLGYEVCLIEPVQANALRPAGASHPWPNSPGRTDGRRR